MLPIIHIHPLSLSQKARLMVAMVLAMPVSPAAASGQASLEKNPPAPAALPTEAIPATPPAATAAPEEVPDESPALSAPADPVLPSRPASHILDLSGMLPEQVQESLSGRLQELQSRTGLGLYLVIYTYLTEETADQRSARLHGAWLEAQVPGIVVVHDRSTGRLSFAGSDDPRMPAADGLRALYRFSDAAAKSLPPESTARDRLLATVNNLADGLKVWQKNGQLPVPPPAVAPSLPAAAKSGQKSLGAAGPAPKAGSPHTLPPWQKPKSFLLDEAGIFRDPAVAASILRKLEALDREHGVQLYVVTLTWQTPDLTVSLADQLALAWFPDSVGGVMVYDRSRPDTISFAGPPRLDRWLSPVQLEQVHSKALEASKTGGNSPAARLEAAVDSLLREYREKGVPIFEESRDFLPPVQRRLLPWVLAGFAVSAAMLALIKRHQDRSDRRRRTVFLFPEVYVPERLGAPHGGGVAAETSPPPLNGSVPSQ